MLKKLFLLTLALNVVPFMYKGKALFVHAVYAQDFGDEGGGGGGGGDGDGGGDNPGGCGPTPSPTTEYSTYTEGNELFSHTCTTTYPDCNGNGGSTGCVDVLLGTLDCHGDLNGSAYLDDCNQCVGGNTGLTACVPCSETDYDAAVQEYNDYIVWTPASATDIYTDPTTSYDSIGTETPNVYSGTFIVGTGGFGSWDIRASIQAKYYNHIYTLVNPLRNAACYDLFFYQVSDGFFNGSNFWIETTYSTITPTTNDVYSNDTPDTYGMSRIVGTITNKTKFKIKLPYCDKMDLESHQAVDVTMHFYPR